MRRQKNSEPWYYRAGLTSRAEQLFEVASTTFVMVLAAAWAFVIVNARSVGDKINLVTPTTTAVASALSSNSLGGEAPPTAAYVTDALNDVIATLSESALGESGKLRATLQPGERPGIVNAAVAIGKALKPITNFNLITPRPASDKRRGRIGLYYIGNWPSATKTKGGRVDYSPPSGFIEVTRSTADTRLSDHFRLRDFLTHDQQNVWPKYVVVNLRLVDKLELVLDDLKQRGIDPTGVRVMSGFRTPQYNAGGGDPRGRAGLSRHMYGDAADIYIDDGGNGRMDDLNGDGRVDINDARVILRAVDRVEQAHPSLIGGAGVYAGTSAHGPFIHIDTRGYPARWIGTGDS